MGTKLKPGRYDCYHHALPDEPIFVLLARDPAAPATVNHWAVLRSHMISAGEAPASDAAMLEEARTCAEAMRAWRLANWPARRAEAAALADPAWNDDRPLPEDAAIAAAHPLRSGDHARYMEALRLVGAKRSKHALVDLVNWLLSRIPAAQGGESA